MIELYVVGNKIKFHKYLIECNVTEEIFDKLRKYRIESYGILCDNDDELREIEKVLNEHRIEYKVKNIEPTPEQLAKAMEIDGKVGSRTEALNYILGNEKTVDINIEIEKLKDEIESLKEKLKEKEAI